MKKKIKSVITTMSIVYIISIIILPIYSFAFDQENIITDDKHYSTAYQEYLKLSEKEKKEIGVIPNMYDIPVDMSKIRSRHAIVGNSGNSGIPASYILTKADVDQNGSVDINVSEYGNLPMRIKNQNPYETCWAFTSINTLETNLALRGYRQSNGQLYDFSELHLDYLGQEGLKDEGGNVIVPDRKFHSPGNFYHFLIYALENKYGVVLESEVPYNATITEEDEEYLYSLFQRATLLDIEYPSIDKVQNRYLDLSDGQYYGLTDEIITALRNQTKQHIMENGALYTAIDSDCMVWSNGQPIAKDGYLNIQTDGSKVVLNGKTSIPDHAVTIIGWDDNFSRNNFPESCRPATDGAYIAMNSWGEGLGANNVFYISYEDYLVETQLAGVKESKLIDPLAIGVTVPPDKTEYFAGETFDPAGMVVKALYQDGEEREIAPGDYTIQYMNGEEKLTEDDMIIIQHEENEMVYTAWLDITVYKAKSEILKGDINKDGSVTLYDAFTMLRKLITGETLNLEEQYIMDFNNDENVVFYDAFSFLRDIILN